MNVVQALDNELQHHRMFPEFLALGLDAKHFYDDDADTFQSVRKELKGMSPRDHVGSFLLKYVTLIAPGGIGKSLDQRRKAKSFLRSQSGQGIWRVWRTWTRRFSHGEMPRRLMQERRSE